MTGKGQTAAVTEAVREQIARVNEAADRQRRLEKMLAVAEKTGPLLEGLDMEAPASASSR